MTDLLLHLGGTFFAVQTRVRLLQNDSEVILTPRGDDESSRVRTESRVLALFQTEDFGEPPKCFFLVGN